MYGSNDAGSRRKLWEDLIRTQPTLPWIDTRDFNAIRSSSEKAGSDFLNLPAMLDFNGFINDASLIEMATTSSGFTWCNMNHSRPIHCRLDRTLISMDCLALFPTCVTHVGARLTSDHNPLLIKLPSSSRRVKDQFKFFNHWTAHSDYVPLLARYWSFQVQGTQHTILSRSWPHSGGISSHGPGRCLGAWLIA